MNDTLVNVRGLSRITGLPATWLHREADAGRIPCLKAGRTIRFNPDAVMRVLVERAASERQEASVCTTPTVGVDQNAPSRDVARRGGLEVK